MKTCVFDSLQRGGSGALLGFIGAFALGDALGDA
jgi:hypothetical protein